MMRSRSRWNTMRNGCSGSGWRRPRESRLRIAYGASIAASRASRSARLGIEGTSRSAPRPARASRGAPFAASPSAVLAGGPTMRPRFVLSAFCFTCLALSYMDRWNLSVAAPLLMREFGWSETTMGFVQSVFFWGFTLSHLPGGWLADRFGGRRVLGAGTLGWTLATAATPLAGG